MHSGPECEGREALKARLIQWDTCRKRTLARCVLLTMHMRVQALPGLLSFQCILRFCSVVLINLVLDAFLVVISDSTSKTKKRLDSPNEYDFVTGWCSYS